MLDAGFFGGAIAPRSVVRVEAGVAIERDPIEDLGATEPIDVRLFVGLVIEERVVRDGRADDVDEESVERRSVVEPEDGLDLWRELAVGREAPVLVLGAADIRFERPFIGFFSSPLVRDV
jgi:hypothetical protein